MAPLVHTRDVVRAWLDSLSGLGAIVVGMRRHGYELRLSSDENGWKASFLLRTEQISGG